VNMYFPPSKYMWHESVERVRVCLYNMNKEKRQRVTPVHAVACIIMQPASPSPPLPLPPLLVLELRDHVVVVVVVVVLAIVHGRGVDLLEPLEHVVEADLS